MNALIGSVHPSVDWIEVKLGTHELDTIGSSDVENISNGKLTGMLISFLGLAHA